MSVAFSPRSRTCGTSQAGFTLLESLVAIALLATALVAIFALVGNLLDSANRVGRANRLSQMTLNAIEAIAAVNPMLEESGKLDLGPYAVSWTSLMVTPPTERAGSLYRLALYECDVRIQDPSGSMLTQFKLRRVGYKVVHDVGPLLGGPSAPGVALPPR